MASKGLRKRKPVITVLENGPYIVRGLEHFKDSEGRELPVQPAMSLCRCGASRNKPYCDGSHTKIGFAGGKDPNRASGKVNEWRGKGITIVDNTDVCCRDMSCINNLPQVFTEENPDAASVKEIIETIKKCPSGALTYKMGGRHCQSFNREPAITVAKDGPFKVVGGIRLKDDMESKPACPEHYTLCRCGHSKNKPFCDGSHLDIGFKGDG
jgi:CDGSH-type Zn-finger protein